MAKSIFASLLKVLVVFAIAAVIGWGTIFATTGSPNFLDRAMLPTATETTAAPQAVEDNLGTILGDQTTGNSAAQQQAQIEQMRRDTAKGLETGLFRIILAGFVIAALWTIYACVRAPRVGGVSGMRSASGMWGLGLLVLLVASIIMAWWVLRSGGAAQAVSPSRVYPYGIGAVVLAALAYHLSTAIAAPTVLRTSVPLATLIVPVRRTSR